MNSYENRTFREAAKAAKIKGTDWRGNEAIDDFSEYYHTKYDRWERQGHGYHGILRIARDWWSNNRHRYSD